MKQPFARRSSLITLTTECSTASRSSDERTARATFSMMRWNIERTTTAAQKDATTLTTSSSRSSNSRCS